MLRAQYLEKIKGSGGNRVTNTKIKSRFAVHSIVAILGPRQCGKTTLAREYIKSKNIPSENYFDLEDPTDLAG